MQVELERYEQVGDDEFTCDSVVAQVNGTFLTDDSRELPIAISVYVDDEGVYITAGFEGKDQQFIGPLSFSLDWYTFLGYHFTPEGQNND